MQGFYSDIQYLVMLIIAHVCANFVLQTKKMVEGKAKSNKAIFFHILIVFISASVFTLSWEIPLIIAVFHSLTDFVKVKANKRWDTHPFRIFLIDQAIHIFVICVVWSIFFKKLSYNQESIIAVLKNTKYLIIALGYIIVIWPSVFIIKYSVDYLNAKSKTPTAAGNENVYRGGMFIGQFERIIILTFVLLGQYEAIGFLITGKSIIRFKENDKQQTEYVLFGTMLSYAIAICIGVLIKSICKIA